MINEKRVRLMTKLADFEENHELDIEDVRTYYRSDYIGSHLIKNFFRGTAAFLIGTVLWAAYSFEAILNRLSTMDVVGLGMQVLIWYAVLMVVFLGITYGVFTVSFYRKEKKLQRYRLMLQRLVEEYDREQIGSSPDESRRVRRERRERGGRRHGDDSRH